jgi:hypothetical protein
MRTLTDALQSSKEVVTMRNLIILANLHTTNRPVLNPECAQCSTKPNSFCITKASPIITDPQAVALLLNDNTTMVKEDKKIFPSKMIKDGSLCNKIVKI